MLEELLGGKDKKQEKPEPKANLGKISGGESTAAKTFEKDMQRQRQTLATRRQHRQ